MHAFAGIFLGAVASIPAGDLMVTVSLALLFAVGCGITGFICTEIEKAR
jgi:hypothetical protein